MQWADIASRVSLGFAGLSLVVAGFAFVLGQVLVHQRARSHVEKVASRALAYIAHNVLVMTVERLAIRFDQRLLRREGHTLREYRATSALKMLAEVDTADLPIDALDGFVNFSVGIQALNLAMNAEKPDKPVSLIAYRSVFEKTLENYKELQVRLFVRTGLIIPAPTWTPPARIRPLIWNRFEREKARDPRLQRIW